MVIGNNAKFIYECVEEKEESLEIIISSLLKELGNKDQKEAEEVLKVAMDRVKNSEEKENNGGIGEGVEEMNKSIFGESGGSDRFKILR